MGSSAVLLIPRGDAIYSRDCEPGVFFSSLPASQGLRPLSSSVATVSTFASRGLVTSGADRHLAWLSVAAHAIF